MPDYFSPRVPRLEAQIIAGKKSYGRTVPVEMVCADGNRQLERYVIKFYADVNLGRDGLVREVYGAILGQYFGLPVPNIAIVDIPPTLYLTTADRMVSEKLLRSPGLNFGSRSVETEFLPSIALRANEWQTATDIFAFDMLIQNVDRRVDKPNVYQTGTGLVIIDHEMAFPYGNPGIILGGLPEPWEIAKSLDYTDHPFYSYLRGNYLPFDSFRSKLQKIDSTLLEQIATLMPESWRSEAVGHISAYLLRARDASDRFIHSLEEVLTP